MKLEIKEEFLNGENRLLEIFIFLLSDRYSDRRSQISNKENSYMLMYYNKDQLIKSLKRFSYLEFDDKITPKRTDIYEIVVNSKYEPYSYHFIISFLNEVVGGDFKKIYSVDKFITENRNNLWIFKRFFINFLEMFTNIDDFREIFIKQVENFDDNIFNIYNREMVYLYYLVWESFPILNNKKIDKRLHKIKIKLLDGKALIITKSVKNMEETKIKPYYFTDLVKQKNKYNN